MARITVEDCIDKFESRFELVLVASNRARKLHSGENPTVEKDNDKNTVIALREIADGTINVDKLKDNLIEEYQTVSSQEEEDLSIEQLDSDTENKENEDQEVSKEDINLEVNEEFLETEESIKETNTKLIIDEKIDTIEESNASYVEKLVDENEIDLPLEKINEDKV